MQVQPQAYSSAPQQTPQDQTVATYQEETGYEEYEDYQDQVYTEADNTMDHTMTMQGTQSGKGMLLDICSLVCLCYSVLLGILTFS